METVVIVGAGPSGLTTAYHLKRLGVPCIVLERGATPGDTFARMRPSMYLVSPPFFSELPGLKFPPMATPFLLMPEFHAYLQRFVQTHDLDVRCGVEVLRARTSPDGFVLELADGASLSTRFLVAASGIFGTPYVPPEMGLERATIPWQHAATYREPGALAGREVLVVGSGLSGQEIALELAETRPVTMAARRPIQWIPNPILGIDVHWLAWLPEMIPVRWAEWAVPLAVEPAAGAPIRDAMRSGRILVRPGVTGVEGDMVSFADGSTGRFEALVLATGFRPTVRWLEGLASTNGQRIAAAPDGESTAHPGLFFVGFPFLRTFASRFLRGIRRDAASVAERIAARVRRRPRKQFDA